MAIDVSARALVMSLRKPLDRVGAPLLMAAPQQNHAGETQSPQTARLMLTPSALCLFFGSTFGDFLDRSGKKLVHLFVYLAV
jgi:hypothetical protein